jgi:type II secretory pathway component PulJ
MNTEKSSLEAENQPSCLGDVSVGYSNTDWFEKKVLEIQQSEIELFGKQLEENNSGYFDEVTDAGFDNTHDYEEWLMNQVIKRVGIVFLIITSITLAWLFL